ncbi:glucose-fructose oxidoreductase domain-containing protein 1-like [Branchiostoma lanceolatum]|uniref:glucose-fructose oxidoreductase domain-containing protein 1-like n=1 Tax=Branchiostoma lanceolatum TaxID=7740 RepID=UPI0034562AD8
MPDKVKMLPGVGVFGTGSLSKVMVCILQSAGFKVAALWGRTNDLAEKVAKELDIPFYTSKVDDVLLHQDVDVVCVENPPHLHAQIAVKTLGIGKHVLCERPAGLCQLDAFRMVNAARYYPTLMSLMTHGLRFLPAFIKMREMIRHNEIGDILVCEVRVHCGSLLHEKYNWMCDEVMGGGVLNTIGSHIVDVITYLTNQKAAKVQGTLKTFLQQTEKIRGIRHITSDDFCSFQMQLEKGACATVTLNSHMPGRFLHEVLVVGKKGSLVVRDADLYGQTNDSCKEEILLADTTDELPSLKKLGITNNSGDLPVPYLKGLLRLVDALKESFGKVEDRRSWAEEAVDIAATFEDGLYVQTVLDAIRKSNQENGGWQKVNIMKEEPDPNPFLSSALRHSQVSLH